MQKELKENAICLFTLKPKHEKEIIPLGEHRSIQETPCDRASCAQTCAALITYSTNIIS